MNNEEQINKVIDYIEEHLQDENLTLTTIAQEIGYLKYHLYRMFTMIAGITIYPKAVFCPRDYHSGKMKITDNTISIHWFNASWKTPHQKRMLKVRRIIGDKLYFKLVDVKNKIIRKGK